MQNKSLYCRGYKDGKPFTGTIPFKPSLYRLTNKECPDDIFGIFDTFQYYYGNFGKPNYVGSSCSGSEYGCCHYNNQCSFAMEPPASRNYMSGLSLYNEYVTNNNGYCYSQVWKEDDNGSNCLPIEDIIIKNVLYNIEKLSSILFTP